MRTPTSYLKGATKGIVARMCIRKEREGWECVQPITFKDNRAFGSHFVAIYQKKVTK